LGFDIVIENGTLYDGSGAAGARLDVGIAADHIAAVGELSGAEAARRLDATGMAVCPGFIDIHSHSDLTLIYNYRAESKAGRDHGVPGAVRPGRPPGQGGG